MPTDTNLNTENIVQQNEQRTAEAKSIQQDAVRQTKTSSAIQTTINDRYSTFISAQQLSVEMLELYRRQRKLMWIYVALLVALLCGLAYMYYASFVPAMSIFTRDGRAHMASGVKALPIFNKTAPAAPVGSSAAGE